MRIAETVTFGGSGFDRAAGLRSEAAGLTALLSSSDARVMALWRGKPLFAATGVAWLPADHAVFADAGDILFLGRDGDGPRFARDVSAWTPPEGAEAPAAGFFDATEQRHPACPDDHRFAELRGLMAGLPARDAELAATAKALLSWHRSHAFCSACGARSAMAQGGWQRSCGACGAQHFPRTDPVVIMLVTRGNRVLLGRSPGWPEGMYSLLAGFMEPGETIEAAVRREVAEETGVGVGQVTYLASQPWPYPSSLMIGCAGEALSDEIKLDPAELEAARWVSREEMAQVFAGEHPDIKAPRKGAIAGFLLAAWLADRLD